MDTIGKKSLFDYIISKLKLAPNAGYSILDFGCGAGDFLGLVSRHTGFSSRIFGIDSAETSIKGAREKYPNINFACDKYDGKIDFPDASFDLIVTIDVIECITDRDRLINEFHRILKPSGKIMAAHWDWDTMVYSATCKGIARKAISAFSDWKQPWMDACDGQMGRKLWGLFEGSGKFHGKPDSFNYIETEYKPGKYGFYRMADIAGLVGTGGISRDEYDQLHSELMIKDGKREYIFCLTSFIYTGDKV